VRYEAKAYPFIVSRVKWLERLDDEIFLEEFSVGFHVEAIKE
jgi:hypothetical protein